MLREGGVKGGRSVQGGRCGGRDEVWREGGVGREGGVEGEWCGGREVWRELVLERGWEV